MCIYYVTKCRDGTRHSSQLLFWRSRLKIAMREKRLTATCSPDCTKGTELQTAWSHPCGTKSEWDSSPPPISPHGKGKGDSASPSSIIPRLTDYILMSSLICDLSIWLLLTQTSPYKMLSKDDARCRSSLSVETFGTVTEHKKHFCGGAWSSSCKMDELASIGKDVKCNILKFWKSMHIILNLFFTSIVIF